MTGLAWTSCNHKGGFAVLYSRALFTCLLDLLGFIHVLRFRGERERAQPAHEMRLILEGYSWDSKFDQNTVRDSGNVYGIRDLTFTGEAGFAKIWARYARLGKKTIFGMVMTEGRDAGFLWKRSGNAGSGHPF